MTLHASTDAADQVPHDLFIAGLWQSAVGGTMTVVNPATEEVIAEVADADVADAERALRAAADAQPGWSATPARTRSEILYRTYQLMVGLRSAAVSALAWAHITAFAGGVDTVSKRPAIRRRRWLAGCAKLVVEPTAAVAAVSLLEHPS